LVGKVATGRRQLATGRGWHQPAVHGQATEFPGSGGGEYGAFLLHLPLVGNPLLQTVRLLSMPGICSAAASTGAAVPEDLEALAKRKELGVHLALMARLEDYLKQGTDQGCVRDWIHFFSFLQVRVRGSLIRV
jgi:hypothetical protein